MVHVGTIAGGAIAAEKLLKKASNRKKQG